MERRIIEQINARDCRRYRGNGVGSCPLCFRCLQDREFTLHVPACLARYERSFIEEREPIIESSISQIAARRIRSRRLRLDLVHDNPSYALSVTVQQPRIATHRTAYMVRNKMMRNMSTQTRKIELREGQVAPFIRQLATQRADPPSTIVAPTARIRNSSTSVGSNVVAPTAQIRNSSTSVGSTVVAPTAQIRNSSTSVGSTVVAPTAQIRNSLNSVASSVVESPAANGGCVRSIIRRWSPTKSRTWQS